MEKHPCLCLNMTCKQTYRLDHMPFPSRPVSYSGRLKCKLYLNEKTCQNLPKHFKIISGKECVTQLKLVLRIY